MNRTIIDYIQVCDSNKDQQLKDFQSALWTPDVEMLSPIKPYKKTPFPKRLTFNIDLVLEDDFYDADFEENIKLKVSSDRLDDGPLKLDKLKLSLEESVVEQSIITTPKLRKSNKEIISTIRRLNFDIPEDYELSVKSAVINDLIDTKIEETSV